MRELPVKNSFKGLATPLMTGKQGAGATGKGAEEQELLSNMGARSIYLQHCTQHLTTPAVRFAGTI
jgi:hypothetical protein